MFANRLRGSSLALRVLFVSESVPHDRHGGGGITELGIAQALGRIPGVSISLFSLREERNLHGANRDEIWSSVAKTFQSATVATPLSHRISSERNALPISILGVRFSLRRFRSGFAYRNEVSAVARSANFDLLVSYGWDAAQASSRSNLPKIALLGDPLGLPYILRKYLFPNPKWRLRHRLLLEVERSIVRTWSYFSCRRVLRTFSHVGAFANHHADDYQKLSGRLVRYIPTPTPVRVGNGLVSNLQTKTLREKPLRLGMIGHLNGTATLQGLAEFHNTLVGGLASDLNNGSITLDIAGGYAESVPMNLRLSMEAYGANFLGQIWPPDSFFDTIDVLLVPTSIPLGIRVRILTAMGLGVPVLAHEMNAQGIPELVDGRNSFLYRSSDEFYAKLELLRIFEVRRVLIKGGKRTISRSFSMEDRPGGNWLIDLVTSFAERRTDEPMRGAPKKSFRPTPCPRVG